MTGIADTGLLVAFANRNDRHHDWAVSAAEQADEPFLTSEAVLAETAFHLRSTRIVLDMVADGLVQIALDVSTELPHLTTLAKRHVDRQPDLADLCVIRLSELHPRHRVYKVDTDFHVYRRNRREVIPLVCPPSR